MERKCAMAPLRWRKGEVSGRLSILLSSPRFVNPLTKLTKLVVSTLGFAVGKAANTGRHRAVIIAFGPGKDPLIGGVKDTVKY